MKIFLSLWLAVCGLAIAQVPDGAKPASTNVQGARYPMVYPDRRVTFQVKAPDAN